MSSAEFDRNRREYEREYRGFMQTIEHPWHALNPVSIYYRHEQERAISYILRSRSNDLDDLRCLDVGCGYGGFIRFLAASGVNPRNIHGIDIIPRRAIKARELAPKGATILVSDASRLPYPGARFHLVSQLTVISSIFDSSSRARVCAEIERVLLPGGQLIWYDMYRTRSRSAMAIPLSEIKHLLPKCQIVEIRRLHSLFSSRTAAFSPALSMLLDKIPVLPKTHYLVLLKRV